MVNELVGVAVETTDMAPDGTERGLVDPSANDKVVVHVDDSDFADSAANGGNTGGTAVL